MKSRPILFSAPMVRALLAGTKTQTRRLVKPQPDLISTDGAPTRFFHKRAIGSGYWLQIACPYGQPGDQLWVRETWAEGIHQMVGVDHWAYAADHFGLQQRLGERWKPSIHMPRAASRITLEITGVRVERLQDISEADARAEGVDFDPGEGGAFWVPGLGCASDSATNSYRKLWEEINGPGSWDLNPWVWALDFRRIT